MDWIRLSSGEWLRGEIHLLRDDSFEFESKELDDLVLDWDDVAEIRSPRILTYAFEENGVATGTSVMRDDVVIIRRGEQIQEYPRADLLAIIEGKPTEWNYWSAKLGISLIARTGNTEQKDYAAIIAFRRQSPLSRLDLEYRFSYARTNDVKSVDNHLGRAKFDYLISQGLFVTPLAIELYSDEFQNIQLRTTAAAGVGYFLVRHSKLEWSVLLSAGYQHTRFASSEPDQPLSEDSFVIIPATNLEMDITDKIELDARYTAQVTLPDTKGTVQNAYVALSFELISFLDFDTSLTWDRVENPKTDAEGRTPERDDFRFYCGLGLEL